MHVSGLRKAHMRFSRDQHCVSERALMGFSPLIKCKRKQFARNVGGFHFSKDKMKFIRHTSYRASSSEGGHIKVTIVSP